MIVRLNLMVFRIPFKGIRNSTIFRPYVLKLIWHAIREKVFQSPTRLFILTQDKISVHRTIEGCKKARNLESTTKTLLIDQAPLLMETSTKLLSQMKFLRTFLKKWAKNKKKAPSKKLKKSWWTLLWTKQVLFQTILDVNSTINLKTIDKQWPESQDRGQVSTILSLSLFCCKLVHQNKFQRKYKFSSRIKSTKQEYLPVK